MSSQDLMLVTELVRYGTQKGVSASGPDAFAGSVLGGLIAGFSRHGEIADLGAFLDTVTNGDSTCRMMRAESLLLFRALGAPETLASIERSEDPLLQLVQMVVGHPCLAQLRNLFRAMPGSAAELASATGVLVALTICRFMPGLAQRVIDSSRG